MNQATAATVVSALVTAGYQAQVSSGDGVAWKVYASTIDGSLVPSATVQSFATAHGVIGEVSQAVFV